eukprot:jgi/Chlat1/8973/Chrsp94S08335
MIPVLIDRLVVFVPFRDSRLTRLLKDGLCGNSRTVMVATVSCSSNQYHHSVNTLKYADRAKEIKTAVRENRGTVQSHVEEYQRIIDNLQSEVRGLRRQLAAGGVRKQLPLTVRSPSTDDDTDEHAAALALGREMQANIAERARLQKLLFKARSEENNDSDAVDVDDDDVDDGGDGGDDGGMYWCQIDEESLELLCELSEVRKRTRLLAQSGVTNQYRTIQSEDEAEAEGGEVGSYLGTTNDADSYEGMEETVASAAAAAAAIMSSSGGFEADELSESSVSINPTPEPGESRRSIDLSQPTISQAAAMLAGPQREEELGELSKRKAALEKKVEEAATRRRKIVEDISAMDARRHTLAKEMYSTVASAEVRAVIQMGVTKMLHQLAEEEAQSHIAVRNNIITEQNGVITTLWKVMESAGLGKDDVYEIANSKGLVPAESPSGADATSHPHSSKVNAEAAAGPLSPRIHNLTGSRAMQQQRPSMAPSTTIDEAEGNSDVDTDHPSTSYPLLLEHHPNHNVEYSNITTQQDHKAASKSPHRTGRGGNLAPPGPGPGQDLREESSSEDISHPLSSSKIPRPPADFGVGKQQAAAGESPSKLRPPAKRTRMNDVNSHHQGRAVVGGKADGRSEAHGNHNNKQSPSESPVRPRADAVPRKPHLPAFPQAKKTPLPLPTNSPYINGISPARPRPMQVT